MKYISYYNSPIGLLQIVATSQAVLKIDSIERKEKENENILTKKVKQELMEYFQNERKSFDVPLAPSGTTFQQLVWKKLQMIPYGKTKSYQEIAIELGNKKAVRAVANAIGKNPILILIPCHRVIGKNGNLTGFRIGLPKKQILLKIENPQ